MANLAQCSILNQLTRLRKLVKTARKDVFFDSVFKNENLMRNISYFVRGKSCKGRILVSEWGVEGRGWNWNENLMRNFLVQRFLFNFTK